jgi:hypothetical protein
MFLTIAAVLLAGGWQFQTITDELTDATISVAVLQSEAGSESMHLMCSEGTVALVVKWSTYVGPDKTVDVLSRLDSATADDFQWDVSQSDATTIQFPPTHTVEPFVRRMSASRKMLIRVSPQRDTSSLARFNTSGLSELLPKFKSCNFTGDEK